MILKTSTEPKMFAVVCDYSEKGYLDDFHRKRWLKEDGIWLVPIHYFYQARNIKGAIIEDSLIKYYEEYRKEIKEKNNQPKEYTKCPKCESHKIFRLRIDSDWAYGQGDYYPVNIDISKNDSNFNGFYTEEELKYNAKNRPDIELYHCLNCNSLFE
jgi:hypothetical protein